MYTQHNQNTARRHLYSSCWLMMMMIVVGGGKTNLLLSTLFMGVQCRTLLLNVCDYQNDDDIFYLFFQTQTTTTTAQGNPQIAHIFTTFFVLYSLHLGCYYTTPELMFVVYIKKKHKQHLSIYKGSSTQT